MSNETEALVATEAPSTGLATLPTFGANMQLQTYEQAWRLACMINKSGWAPKDMNSPEKLMVAMQLGAEVGLSPMSSMQNICSINGRPSVYGDAALAIVRASGELESITEVFEGTPFEDDFLCRVTSKRKGMDEMEHTFSVADAKRAGLWGKVGPWSTSPKRMLRFRSRGFNLRDNFGDRLKGMITREEAQDMPKEINITPEPEQSIEKKNAIMEEVKAMPAVKVIEAKKAPAPEPAPKPEKKKPAPKVEKPAAAAPEAPEPEEVILPIKDYCEKIKEAGLRQWDLDNYLRTKGIVEVGKTSNDLDDYTRQLIVDNLETYKTAIEAQTKDNE